MKKRAFTLVELLVVIAIVGILVAILVPTVGSGIEKSRKVKCMAQLRQISIAAQTQFDDTKRYMPYRGTAADNYGWACADLLPYLGDEPSVFQCPSQKHPTLNDNLRIRNDTIDTGKYSTYEINGYLSSYGTGNRQYTKKSLIEDYSLAAIAYDYPYMPDGSQGARAHKNGINVAYLDGHAAWLTDQELNIGTAVTASNFYCQGHTVWEINNN